MASRKNKSTAEPYRRRSPGYTNRRHRELMEKAVIRARLESTFPELDEAQLATKIEEEYEHLLPSDPKVRKYFEETAQVSVSPLRRGIVEAVEVKAARSLGLTKSMEERLCVCAHGRPTDRRLVLAALERNILENGRPEIIANHMAFQENNEILAWAYGWPAREGSNRNVSNVYRTLHSTLARCSPDICLQLNVAALVALREELNDPDVGRYLVIDGTDIIAPREQRPSDPCYPVEEGHLRRSLHEAAFTTHGGRKSWRGYRLVCITDVKTGLAIGFILLPGNRPEWEGLADLLNEIHATWKRTAGAPWEPEYLVGDSHFDNAPVCRMLEERFAIHPVFPRGIAVGRNHEWHDNEGVPYCAHGDMKLLQSQYFVDHAKRRELGLAPGDVADLSRASFRWVCPDGAGCQATTTWSKNPRLYTYLPPRGEHHKRVALRKALLVRRNVSESLNARIKGRGIGNRGMNVPKWVSTDDEMRWLCYGTCLGFALVRLAHETGAYEAMRDEAAARGLLAPCQPRESPSAVAA